MKRLINRLRCADPSALFMIAATMVAVIFFGLGIIRYLLDWRFA